MGITATTHRLGVVAVRVKRGSYHLLGWVFFPHHHKVKYKLGPIRDSFAHTHIKRKGMFYLTTHSTHFIYGYIASNIWQRTTQIVREETRCRHMGSFICTIPDRIAHTTAFVTPVVYRNPHGNVQQIIIRCTLARGWRGLYYPSSQSHGINRYNALPQN